MNEKEKKTTEKTKPEVQEAIEKIRERTDEPEQPQGSGGCCG